MPILHFLSPSWLSQMCVITVHRKTIHSLLLFLKASGNTTTDYHKKQYIS